MLLVEIDSAVDDEPLFISPSTVDASAAAAIYTKCMLYNCLEWLKWVLMNLYYDRQLYNTLIPPSNESPTNLHLYFMLEWIRELTLRYTTPDIHCRHKLIWHECDGGIRLRLHRFELSLCLLQTCLYNIGLRQQIDEVEFEHYRSNMW